MRPCAFLVLAAVLAWPAAATAQEDTAKLGAYAQGGVELGFAPGQTSVLPGIFLKGGPTYGVARAAGELSLALGPSTGRGFAILAGALLSLGVHTPATSGRFAWFADAHFGPMLYHRESPGQTDASGLWGGLSTGVVAYDAPGHSIGAFAGITALTPLRSPERNTGDVAARVVPLFLRAGVMAR